MKVLIVHGYLLRGTGSNIYNASLARALARLGHEVHLFCQERHWDAPDGVTVHNPDIGRILPVYVADRYDGFDAKPYPQLTEAELESYMEANVAAIGAAPACDVALANHLVMNPAILARAGRAPFAVKVHGSALEYTVRPHPERFVPYALEGRGAADALRSLDPARDRIVSFVGKLIVSKGVDLLLAAWPLVVARVPEARLVVVGFGTYRAALGRFVEALRRRDVDDLREIAV